MRSGNNRGARLSAILVPGVCLAASACAPKPPQGLIDQIPGAAMTRAELRAGLREVAMELIGYAKARTYEIYEAAEDAETRWAALLIAVRSNEIMITAVTHRDPVAALLDTWAMVMQWQQFIGSEEGSAIFPEYTDEMLANLARMEENVNDLALRLAVDAERVAAAREEIAAWVADHPLTSRMYRPSVAPQIVGLIPEQQAGLFSVAETLDENLERVAMRLEILNAQLPQQIAWNAGILIEKRLGEVEIAALADQSARVMTIAEGVPELVDTQVRELAGQIDAQRTDTLAAVEVIRDDTLAEIDRQRIATIASIDAGVDRAIDRIRDESSVVIGRVDRIANDIVGDIHTQVLATVDRAFRRLLILVGVLLGGAALIATWALRHPVRATRER